MADARLQVQLNPMDYGAAGDGKADDSASIQALLADYASRRGGMLTLPSRRFRITTPLRIMSKSVSIDGGANGFSSSPNAEHPSQTGSEFLSENNAIEIGFHDASDLSNTFTKLGGLNFRNLYFWGPGVYSGESAIYFDNHVDHPQFNNILMSNYQWGLYSDTVLDDATLYCIYATHCSEGIHFSEKSLAAYVKFANCTIADNDGTGIYIHPQSNSFCCQMTNCVLVRNARTAVQDGCNVYWGARESIIANNIIHAAGYHFYNEAVLGHIDNQVSADGIVVDGSENLITGNQILDHAKGTGIVVTGSNNKVINNSFVGRVGSSKGSGNATTAISRNQLDINVKPTAIDTTIVQQGLFTLIDEGKRTIINGLSKNEGDPDTAGDWNGIRKPDGVVIYDTVENASWLYGQFFPKGRIKISQG